MRKGVAAGAARLAALACRACAWALAALVVAGAVLPAGARTWLLAPTGFFSRLVPGPLAGLLVFPTPLGGSFRGDPAIVAIVLLVLDWILCRVSASPR